MISVCIPTYNGEKFLKQQLDSILLQLSNNDEIIVSDDSSTDATIEIIKSYSDSRIKILENNHFKSPIFNLENALKYANGDYIFLADQDDVWYSKKVETLMKYLKKYDCVISDASIVNSEMEEISPSLFYINSCKEGFVHNIIKNGFTGCCMAFNKKILQMVLPFPKDIPMHDSWIGLVAEKYGTVLFLNEPLIYYRRHGNNVSSTTEKSKYTLLKKLQFRLILIKNIFKLKKRLLLI